MEGFWGILKREKYYGRRFTSKADLIIAIESYISYYNTERIQCKLRLMTPVEYHKTGGFFIPYTVFLLLYLRKQCCTVIFACRFIMAPDQHVSVNDERSVRVNGLGAINADLFV